MALRAGSSPLLALASPLHPDEIERALHEADHVARAFTAIDDARHLGRPDDAPT